MKLLVPILILIVCCNMPVFPSSSNDSACAENITILEKQLKATKDTLVILKHQLSASQIKTKEFSFWQKLYILAPFILFLFIYIFVFIWLIIDKYKISEALQGDIPVTFIKTDNSGNSKVEELKDAQGKPVFPKSTSRLIAFFSGMTAVIIALSLVSYTTYFSIAGIPAPDYNKIWGIICGLGIGVVPYGVMKWKEKK